MSETNLDAKVPTQKEVLSFVVEKGGEIPGIDEVLEAFEQKRTSLRGEIESLESKELNPDLFGVIQGRNDIAEARRELEQVDALWAQLGGEDIDNAVKHKEELDSGEDASDHTEANADIKRARSKFYENFLDEYSRDNESTEPKGSGEGGEGEKPEGPKKSERDEEALAGLKTTETWKRASAAQRKQLEKMLDDINLGGEDEEAKKGKPSPEKIVEILLGRIPGLENMSPEEQDRYRKMFEESLENDLIDVDRLMKEEGLDEETESETKIEAIKRELGPESEKFTSALKEYAKIKADHEIKGFIGRKKRLELLKNAEMELIEAKLAYAKALVIKKNEAGLYDGDTESIEGQMSDDMMDEIRLLDKEARTATNDELKDRIENRKWYEKMAAAIGKFFNGGSKWYSRLARNAGFGFLQGFGVAASGVGFPVTMAVGATVGAAVYGFSRSTLAEESLKAHEGGTVLTDERAKEILDKIRSNTDDMLEQAKEFAGGILDESRKSGEEVNKRNANRAKKNLGMFSLGYAAGGMLGNLVIDGLNSSSMGSSGEQTHTQPTEGKSMGHKPIPKAKPDVNHFVNIDTNGAPEHGFRDILSQYGGGGNQSTETLFNEVYKQTGGNVFVDGAGNNIPMKEFGGNIGRGFSEWGLKKAAYLSEPAKAILRARGYPV